jgi:lysophospholipase L1-like esterase
MVVALIKPVLAPVLIAQAKRLRKLALELPEPEGQRHGVIPHPAHSPTTTRTISVLIAGDSSAAGVGASTQDEALAPQLAAALSRQLNARVEWHLIAQTGLTSQGVFALLRDQPLPVVDIAIVIVGVNDISNDVPIGHALRARNRIVRLLRERSGIKVALFPAVPDVERFPLLPQPLAWYGGAQARRNNDLQARWAAHPRRCSFVSHVSMDGFTEPALMAKDGFHPAPALYAKVAQHLAVHASAFFKTHAAQFVEKRHD